MTPEHVVELASGAALMLGRLGGFVVVSPFPGRWVPARVRVLVVLGLALPLSMAAPPSAIPVALDYGLVLAAGLDFLVGVFVGAAFYLVLAAAEFMAAMISHASSLATPMSMNPESGQQPVLGQVGVLLAMLVALGAGVHRVVLAYLLESFRALPIGSAIHVQAAIPAYIDLAGRSLEVGMRLAMPVFAVTLAVQGGLAIVSRMAPSLQIFNVGFAVLIVTGLLTFAAAIPSIAQGIFDYTATLPLFLEDLFHKLKGG
jgi:flagellar biosynthetic protein FliR